MDTLWRIEMFGGLRAQQGDRVITRFATRKNGLLLAYLAFYKERLHPRDELIEMLWPEAESTAGRNRLRQALASLRRQIEPPNSPSGSVLLADRAMVGLNSAVVTTDVAEFETLVHSSLRSPFPDDLQDRLCRAVEIYHDSLLPGYYEDWIAPERERLAQLALDALRQLMVAYEQAGETARAIEYAQRAVRIDHLDEDSHTALIRLYLSANQPMLAQRQYRTLERTLREELDQLPSEEIRQLIEHAAVKSRPASAAVAKSVAADRPAIPSSPRKVSPTRAPVGEAGPIPPVASSSTSVSPPIETNLPLQFTRFFGREEEIAQLLSLLQVHSSSPRLITLTGPGGCGKTRLAIEVAQRQSRSTGRSTWFVSLEDLTDARLIPGAIAAALKLPRIAEMEPIEQVVEALSTRPALLVLDNFEQLLIPQQPDLATSAPGASFTTLSDSEASLRIARILLERVPSLVCLITSRQRLELAGEQEFPVHPLPIPPIKEAGKGTHGPDLPAAHAAMRSPNAEILHYAGVQLFLDRAQAARPDFQLTPRTASAIIALLQRLEGIPLAIELAAAWAQTLTAAQMLERLSNDLEILASRRPDLPARHRTLRATMEWGYQLLSPSLQRLFARLSVFRGGWTFALAEAICMNEDGGEIHVGSSGSSPTLAVENDGGKQVSVAPLIPAPSSLDLLAQLRARSLIFTTEIAGEMRFRMLETLRGYAAEQLAPQERSALARRHAQVFLQLAEETAPQLVGAGQDAARQRLEAEHDNLQAALMWALESAPEIALRLSGALWRYWALCGYFSEGRSWLARALQHGTSEQARITALAGAGVLAHYQSDYVAAQEFHTEALALCRAADDNSGVANALNNLGRLAYEQGENDSARAYYEQSMALWRAEGDTQRVAMTLNNLGLMAWERGDLGAASSLFQESLALKRDLGDRQGIANVLNNLGLVAAASQEYSKAQSLYTEALAINRELNNRAFEATNLCNLAKAVAAQRNYPQAQSYHLQSLHIRRELGDKRGIAFSLEGFATLAVEAGQVERASRLLGAAASLRARIGAPVPRADHVDLERARSRALTAMGDEQFTTAYMLGQSLTLEQAIAYALDASDPSAA